MTPNNEPSIPNAGDEGINILTLERSDLAHEALKREYPDAGGTFPSTWTDGYCQALRDLEAGKININKTSSPPQGEEAIEFANFIGDRALPEYSKSTNMWRWWNNNGRYEFATTEQLYALFKADKKRSEP